MAKLKKAGNGHEGIKLPNDTGEQLDGWESNRSEGDRCTGDRCEVRMRNVDTGQVDKYQCMFVSQPKLFSFQGSRALAASIQAHCITHANSTPCLVDVNLPYNITDLDVVSKQLSLRQSRRLTYLPVGPLYGRDTSP